MRIGFNVEGHDHLILRCLIERILGIDPATVASEHVEQPGGWAEVLQVVPLALRKFYAVSADLAVIGIDNDGNEDLMGGAAEDPKHPRHWNHAGTSNPRCRQCQLQEIVDKTRGQLGWLEGRPAKTWPIIISVPVEMIEAWLLIAQGIKTPGGGSLHAEREQRSNMKLRFYGQPEATRQAVLERALPLLRALDSAEVQSLRQYAYSFELFAEQVLQLRPAPSP